MVHQLDHRIRATSNPLMVGAGAVLVTRSLPARGCLHIQCTTLRVKELNDRFKGNLRMTWLAVHSVLKSYNYHYIETGTQYWVRGCKIKRDSLCILVTGKSSSQRSLDLTLKIQWSRVAETIRIIWPPKRITLYKYIVGPTPLVWWY